MDLAWYWHLALGLLGGLVTALVTQGILALRLYRLQLAVATLQQAILTIRTQGAAKARWSKEDQLAQELQSFKTSTKPESDKYANDPIPY